MAAKKKRGRPKGAKNKKKKMDSMAQTDGMLARPEPEQTQPTTLAQVWGDDGMSQYKTMDATEYSDQIDVMSKSDLKNEAIRVGLLPVDNMEQLRIRLLKQFRVHVAGYQRPNFTSYTPKADDEIRKILEEGK